jgi:ParB-like chromosome segregation protein Spo0J
VKIPLNQLTPHPDNPNKMSKSTFAKLVRNIERTGRYEPLIVRTCRSVACNSSPAARCSESALGSNNEQRTMNKEQCFQIINGHHRWLALKHLGKKEADAIVWDIDDDEADILLATLNRLCGQDILDKKLALLKRLNETMRASELAKLLPQTKKQIEKLKQLAIADSKSKISNRNSEIFFNPLVFFVSDEQQQVIETTLNFVIEKQASRIQNRASRRASALSAVCQYYLDHKQAQNTREQLQQYFNEV